MKRLLRDKVIKDVSLRHNIAEYQAELAIMSVFQFTREAMRRNKDESVRLHYFGIFGVKPSLKYYKFKKNAK